jgi:VWFA-related protein
MNSKHRSALRSRCLVLIFLTTIGVLQAGSATPRHDQPDAQQSGSRSTATQTPVAPLKINTRLVVVDVVAQDSKGQAVTDLKESEFKILEDGNKQQITAFSFHHPMPTEQLEPAPVALGPGVIRNLPKFPSNKVLNVILLDGLNSNLLEQAYVRSEMIAFLEKIPSGQPIAIYALGKKLQLLQDFTTDLTELKRIVRAFKGERSHDLSNAAGTPDTPMTLTGWGEQTATATFRAQIEAFAQNDSSDQLDIRVQHTMAALNSLARMLAGYPGRKNLIWISESIPMNIFAESGKIVGQMSSSRQTNLPPDPTAKTFVDSSERNYAAQIDLLANRLTDAQVAVYPIDARGLVNSPFFNVANNIGGRAAMGGLAGKSEGSLEEELFAAHIGMKEIAEKTGGKAFYNRNDIDGALSNSIEDGSTYYVLGYYPESKKWNGEFRKIRVTTVRAGVKLRHRFGYFAVDRDAYMKSHPRERDMAFSEALSADSPVATELQFQATVLPPSAEAQNKSLIIYAIDTRGINFETGKDGQEHAQVDCAVRVFRPEHVDHPVGTEVDRVDATFTQENFKKINGRYLPCQIKLDLPPGRYFLRLGVRDTASGRIGTANTQLVIPPVAAESANKTK